jgi:hypothetical protein
MIYNLSERPYDYAKFGDQVHEWCGFPDHYAPPLSKLFQIVRSMHSWLSADKLNVTVIHCLVLKFPRIFSLYRLAKDVQALLSLPTSSGQVPSPIQLRLTSVGLFRTAEEGLTYFASKRSNNNWGVTNPSQLR